METKVEPTTERDVLTNALTEFLTKKGFKLIKVGLEGKIYGANNLEVIFGPNVVYFAQYGLPVNENIFNFPQHFEYSQDGLNELAGILNKLI